MNRWKVIVMPEPLMGISEVAVYLGVEECTLYKWVHIRKIPYYKVGNLVKFKKDDIERWLSNAKVMAVSR